MCASVSSLLLFTLTTICIFFGTRMVTEGLPLSRQERGIDNDILTGADFLSVFMRSTRQLYMETTTHRDDEEEEENPRVTRSTSFLTSPPAQDSLTTVSAPSSDSSEVVVEVSVSSSVGRTLIHKEIEDTTLRETTTTEDQSMVASEQHPSIVAEANKSEFSVDESEPITTNRDLIDYQGYPATVQQLPANRNSPFNADFIAQQITRNKEKLHPIHQTVIYHNNPREPARARSVSYSTVIQAVPQSDKDWEGPVHDRHERHYENSQTFNNFQNPEKNNSTDYPESRKKSFTTERNWEVPEKAYSPNPHLPTIYGRPEQNYEVDESASVMTNGRIHGIQPNPTVPSKESKKVDDNQKVGYVVEGRNYRKYRVEERTSDGFIVGEYGVVSHDDGSLRGVRYTADGTISPKLIYETLMKFLSL